MGNFANTDLAESLNGTEAADNFIPFSGLGGGNDTFHGLGGFDWIEGGAADDSLFGEGDSDEIYGGDGSDWLYGGDGADALRGGAGLIDRFWGGLGNDRADNMAADRNLAFGEAGNDILMGAGGRDRLVGGTGNDHLEAGDAVALGNDALFGGAGADRIISGGGTDVLKGGFGRDLLDLKTATGAVVLDLRQTEQVVLGTVTVSGFESVLSGSGRDWLTGTDGGNRLNAGAGRDRLNGLDGNDRLTGGLMDDTLSGGAGDDIFLVNNRQKSGADGRDVMTGEAGVDVFVFNRAEQSAVLNPDVITDFTHGQDFLRFQGFTIGPRESAEVVFFTFIGDAGFGSSGAAELCFAGQMLQGDADGDGTADFAINLTDVVSLQRSDFLGGLL